MVLWETGVPGLTRDDLLKNCYVKQKQVVVAVAAAVVVVVVVVVK